MVIRNTTSKWRHQASKLLATTLVLAGLEGCGGQEPIPRSGLTGQLPFPLVKLPQATANLTIHPFTAAEFSRGLSLFSSGQINFADAIKSMVRDRLANQVQIELKESQLPNISGANRRFDGNFTAHGVPIYGTYLAAHLLNDRSPFVLGTMPSISPEAVQNAPTQWPSWEATQDRVKQGISDQGLNTSTLKIDQPKRYYHAASSAALRPAWLMIAKVDGLPYEILADDRELISFSRRFFEVEGVANVVPKNIYDSVVSEYKLKDLTGDGTLTSNYLQARVPATMVQAKEPSTHRFLYSRNDRRFDQTNAYSHTDEHFRWLLGLGGRTYGALPLHLELHQVVNGTTNNALFIPGSEDSGDPFIIELGDGDGIGLQNLPTDWDVPSHEAGHYFVYNYLKVTRDEPLGLHEGIADLLVYLHKSTKGNPQAACLGESICPANTQYCVKSTCLRTGDHDWVYDGPEWQRWSSGQVFPSRCCGHKHGQVISAVVWDLVKNNQMSASDAANLTMTAITYFKADSGIRDFLLSLLIANKTVFNCQYDGVIRQAISRRNFTSFINDTGSGCESLPQLSGTGVNLAPSTSQAATTSSSSKSKFFGIDWGCGTIGQGSDGQAGILLMLFVLPLFFGNLLPAAVKVVATKRRRK